MNVCTIYNSSNGVSVWARVVSLHLTSNLYCISFNKLYCSKLGVYISYYKMIATVCIVGSLIYK